MSDQQTPPGWWADTWSRVAGPLHDRVFARFFAAQCLSFVGDAMLMTTLPLALLDHGFSAGAFGFVLTATSIARVTGLFLGGWLADRVRRDVLLVVGDSLRAVVQLTVVVLLLDGFRATGPLVGLYVLFGIGSALFMPASQGLIAQVTKEEMRVAANGLLASAENLAMVLVPAVGAVVVLAAGSVVGLAVDGVSFVLSGILLSTLRKLWVRQQVEVPSLSGLGVTLMRVVRTGWLRNGILTFTAVNSLGYAPFLVLTPIALDRLHESAAWGFVLAAQAFGAVAGGVLAARLRFARPLMAAFGSCIAWAGLALAVAVGAPLPVILLISVSTGLGTSFLTVLWNTAIQSRVPADQIGRIAAFDSIGSLAVQPIAYSLLGLVAATTAVSTALVVCAGTLVLVLAASCASRSIREFAASRPEVEALSS